MYRTLYVLALLTLQAELAHSFSWDVVAAAKNRIEFYNEEKLTYSVTFTNINIYWITYDPFHNRVVFNNNSMSLLSFDIATRRIQTLFHLPEGATETAYDPVTGIFFGLHYSKLYSYLVKPGSDHEVDANYMIAMKGQCHTPAVDSCEGYIYWIRVYDSAITRARLNGSAEEVVVTERSDTHKSRYSITIDSQTGNMYWTEIEGYGEGLGHYYILNADLNGKHKRTLYHGQSYKTPGLTVSKDFIYWTESTTNYNILWKFPKNLPLSTDVKPTKIAIIMRPTNLGNRFISIAANYAIEEQHQGMKLCKALKRQLPNYSATNDSDSFNVSTGGSLPRVNETKASGESRVSGDTCDVSVCHNYCLQGNCSTSADGQPKCRCNAGYSGVRCEVNECQNYCLNDGVCSLSEQNNPLCQCTGGYQGERCDVPAFLIKCSETVSLLKDIFNADLTSVTEDKGVKSSCASTVF